MHRAMVTAVGSLLDAWHLNQDRQVPYIHYNYDQSSCKTDRVFDKYAKRRWFAYEPRGTQPGTIVDNVYIEIEISNASLALLLLEQPNKLRLTETTNRHFQSCIEVHLIEDLHDFTPESILDELVYTGSNNSIGLNSLEDTVTLESIHDFELV